MPAMKDRRLPVGAEIVPNGGGVHFRVWAPKRKTVRVAFPAGDDQVLTLADEGNGHFSNVEPHAKAGTLYAFLLDDEDKRYPDPVSRFQPQGVHGPSMVVDPGSFKWTDGEWPGIGPAGVVLYEMHVGTFTKEGTWAAANVPSGVKVPMCSS